MGFASSSIAVAATSLVGVGLTCLSGGPEATLGTAAGSFAASVLSNLTVDGLKAVYKIWSDDHRFANDAMVQALRQAQLRALKDLHKAWWHSPTAATAEERAFAHGLAGFLKRPIPQTAQPEQTAWQDTLTNSLNGPPDWKSLAEQALLEELRHTGLALPTDFQTAYHHPVTGWFMRFQSAFVTQISQNQALSNSWTTLQLQILGQDSAQHTEQLRKLLTQVEEDRTCRCDAFAVITGRLEGLKALSERLQAQICGVADWLHFEPDAPQESVRRFSPRNMAIPFYGRRNELDRLQGFLTSKPRFSWWLVTGPGGMGKTRLARQLCYQAAAQGWQVGFLQKTGSLPTSAWNTSHPTLIVVDYVQEKLDRTRELADILARYPTQHPVRLLLLDRQVGDEFDRRFLSSDEAGERLTRTRHPGPETLTLTEPGEDALYDLVKDRPWQEHPTPLPQERASFLSRLKEIDQAQRPLVAMILADATDQPGGLEDLLADLIQRSRDHYWTPRLQGVIEEGHAAVLISAATMLGRIEDDFLKLIQNRLGITITGKMLRACAAAIGSPTPTTRSLEGIQPDLIGEFFALQTLAGDPLDEEPAYAWLSQAAWEQGLRQMSDFAIRALLNFGAFEQGNSQRALDRVTQPEITHLGVSLGLLRLILAVCAERGEKLPWSRLWSLAQQTMQLDLRIDKRLPSILSLCLSNLVIHAVRHGERDARGQIVEKLRNIAGTTPQDSAVRERLAKALFSSMNAAKQENDLPLREALFDEIKTLAKNYPHDEAVRERLAKAYLNSLNHTKNENNLQRRDLLLEEIKALAKDYPQDRTVRGWLTGALFNCLLDAKDENNLPQRDNLLEEIKALATDHPQDSTIRERLARALHHCLHDAKDENNLSRRDNLLEEIRAQARDHPQDSIVRECLIKTLLNCLLDAKDENNLPRRDNLLEEIKALATDHLQDSIVRECLTKALVTTAIRAKEEKNISLFNDCFTAFQALTTVWPKDITIQEGCYFLQSHLSS